MVYLDASALVKLVSTEAETRALRRYLRSHPGRATSDVGVSEVLRAALRRGGNAVARAEDVVARVDRVTVTPDIVDRAGRLLPVHLRTLDALHVATALKLVEELEAFVAYEDRLLEAASAHRLPIVIPA